MEICVTQLGTLPLEKLRAHVPQQDLGLDQELALQCSTTPRSFCVRIKMPSFLMSYYCIVFPFFFVQEKRQTTESLLQKRKNDKSFILFNISPLVKSNCNFQSCTLAESLAAYYSLHLFIWLSHCITNI